MKDLHGQKNVYYQVNATYFSALGEDERKLLLARAIQIFMPGKPQVWYLDLFAGKNDMAAVGADGSGGHKEINRTNVPRHMLDELLNQKIVQDQLTLLRFRAKCSAFDFGAQATITSHQPCCFCITWENNGFRAELKVDLRDYSFSVTALTETSDVSFFMESK